MKAIKQTIFSYELNRSEIRLAIINHLKSLGIQCDNPAMSFYLDDGDVSCNVTLETKEEDLKLFNDPLKRLIAELDLSKRLTNALTASNIYTVLDLVNKIKQAGGVEQFRRSTENLGKKSQTEIEDFLRENSLKVPE